MKQSKAVQSLNACTGLLQSSKRPVAEPARQLKEDKTLVPGPQYLLKDVYKSL